MIIHKTGNLFDTELDSIAHGVNTKGLMGAGIAKAFRSLYPQNYEMYADACKTGRLVPGKMFVWYENGRYIYNIASQDKPGPNAQLKWLRAGMRSAILHAKKSGSNSIAVPRIGAGIGGLNWEDVLECMTKLADDNEFTLEIWTYDG